MNPDSIMKLNTAVTWAERDFTEGELIALGNVCFGLAALRNKAASAIIAQNVKDTLELADELRQDHNVINFPKGLKK